MEVCFLRHDNFNFLLVQLLQLIIEIVSTSGIRLA